MSFEPVREKHSQDSSGLVGSEDIWAIVRTAIFIVREQFLLIISGFVGGLILALLIYAVTPPTYESKSKFAVDKIPFSMINLRVGDALTEQQFLQSLISSIPSLELSSAVAERLGVPDKNVAFAEVEKKASLGKPNTVNIDIANVRGSRMSEIKAVSSNREFASRAANVVADEISDINCISGRLQSIELDILQVRNQIERISQEAVANSADRIKLERQRSELQSHIETNGDISTFPAFAQDTTLNNLKTQYILVQGEYDGIAAVSIRGARLEGKRAELFGLKRKIDAYASSLAFALKSSADISSKSEQDMMRKLSEQQEYLARREQQRVTLMKAIGSVDLRHQLIADDPSLSKEQASVIVVLNKANPSPYRKSPKLSLYLLLGVVLGVGSGTAMALIRHHIDRRMRFPSQIEILGDSRCLAVLLEPQKPTMEHAVQKASSPHGLIYLRSHILRAQIMGREVAHIIAFNDIGHEANSSRVVMELAVLLAKAEKKTLVVDMHFNAPRQATLLGIEPRRTLGEWFFNDEPLKKYVQYSAVRQLALLHPGSVKGDLNDLMSRKPLGPQLKELEADWDFILIDSPSLLMNSSLLMASPQGAQLIAVANYNKAELDDLIEIKARCSREGLYFSGVVLENFPRKRVVKSNTFDIGVHRYIFEDVTGSSKNETDT